MLFSWFACLVLKCHSFADMVHINRYRTRYTRLVFYIMFGKSPTQTGLHSYRRHLKAQKFGIWKKRNCTIHIVKTNALISHTAIDLRLCFHICRKPVFLWRGSIIIKYLLQRSFEPRRQKTGLPGFRPGPTQIRLCSLIKRLEAWNFVFRKERDCTIRVAKTKALISFA